MSYIGNQPPDIGAYDTESFNGGGTSFTLKKSATTPSILLFIDGVRQTPTDAYSVNGVTLTTTATTPSGTDNVTVMFMGDVVDIGAPSNDTVTSAKIVDGAIVNADINASADIAGTKLVDNAITLAKLEDGTQGDILYYGASGAPARLGFGTSGDFLKTQGTGANPVWASAGGNNAPYWHVYLSADEAISNNTWSKVLFDTEVLDSASEYDNSSNYRYTIGTAGKYFVYTNVICSNDSANWDQIKGAIYKNGSAVTGVGHIPGGWYTNTASVPNQVIGYLPICSIMDLSVSDYLEVFVFISAYGTAGDKFDAESVFGGFKLL